MCSAAIGFLVLTTTTLGIRHQIEKILPRVVHNYLVSAATLHFKHNRHQCFTTGLASTVHSVLHSWTDWSQCLRSHDNFSLWIILTCLETKLRKELHSKPQTKWRSRPPAGKRTEHANFINFWLEFYMLQNAYAEHLSTMIYLDI